MPDHTFLSMLLAFSFQSLYIFMFPEIRCVLYMVTSDKRRPVGPTVTYSQTHRWISPVQPPWLSHCAYIQWPEKGMGDTDLTLYHSYKKWFKNNIIHDIFLATSPISKQTCESVSEQQYGFMQRKSTTDVMLVLRIVDGEAQRRPEGIWGTVLMDLEKVYGRVPIKELWYCMRKLGVVGKYVRVAH